MSATARSSRRGGQSSGNSRKIRSPSLRKDSRLVASTCSRGASRTRRSTSGARVSSTCSQLSKISSVGFVWRWVNSAGTGSSALMDSPSVDAMVIAASSGFRTGPKSTKKTLPSKWASRRWPTVTATAVLPIPPGPTTVTKRCCASPVEIFSMTSSRPITRASGEGSERGSGTSTGASRKCGSNLGE